MEIEHKKGETKGVFRARLNNTTIGEMTYEMESPAVMAINHTEVSASERGKGVGMQLLDHAVSYATENGLHIRPVCAFVEERFKKQPEKYRNVILNEAS